MMNKTNYIRAVLVVFWLLFLTRIPAFMMGNLDAITIVSTVVELGFFIWGIVILRRHSRTANSANQRVSE
ncbi:MAG: hypothetical protein KME04_04440 [Pleurocapsa minor GSE-CHR-MK-17-07R]|jgi:hypothetical protein|nr:hypothetical protein [Pleurocapsa minor GSE-CHR-MK 17-07R]